MKAIRYLAVACAIVLLTASKPVVISEAEIPSDMPVKNHAAAPDEIPTDEATWNSCCHHLDCMRAQVSAYYIDKDTAQVTVDRYRPFIMAAQDVHKSKTGQSYYCRRDITRPPSTDNIRCVFIAGGSYASNARGQ